MHNLSWSDLEYILAVAASGSLAAAARQLGVNHSTVLRRVQAFEAQNGIKIFNRLRTGYSVTPEGEMFLNAASSIDEIVQGLERKIVGVNNELSGEISITTTDSLFSLIIDATSLLRKQYPEITFRLNNSNDRLDLDRHDADIAIRASSKPPSHLIGRKISDMGFAIYASRKISRSSSLTPLESRSWLGPDVPLLESIAAKWMKEHIPDSRIVFRCGSFVALAELAERDTGYVLLPRFIGDNSKLVVQTDLNVKTPTAELWVLTHKDVLASPRIRLVTDYLYSHFRDKRRDFAGG